jgi:cytochrome P450
MSEHKRAPGPKGTPIGGNLWSFWLDFFNLLESGHEEYGDVVRYRVLNKTYHLLTHPNDIKHVLLSHKENYNRSQANSSQLLHTITGDSVISLEGKEWQQRRRLCAPAFSSNSLTAYIPAIINCTEETIQKWQNTPEINLESAISSLTANIVGKAFFGSSTSWDENEFEESIKQILSHHWQRIKSPLDLVHKLPLKSRRNFDKAMSYIRSIVQNILDQKHDLDPKCLLARLISAKEDNYTLSAEDLQNEVVTFLLAGHETTATALCWSFYLLAQHPEWQDIIADEAKGNLNPTDSKLDMPQTFNFFQETIRLYPSVWLIERLVLEDDFIQGYHIPKGSTIILSPLTTHRDKKFWESPQLFNPDRFLKAPVKHSYFPFGIGPHTCIGQNFALLECQLILGNILQHYRFELADKSFAPEFEVGITLRMKKPLHLKLKKPGT